MNMLSTLPFLQTAGLDLNRIVEQIICASIYAL